MGNKQKTRCCVQNRFVFQCKKNLIRDCSLVLYLLSTTPKDNIILFTCLFIMWLDLWCITRLASLVPGRLLHREHCINHSLLMSSWDYWLLWKNGPRLVLACMSHLYEASNANYFMWHSLSVTAVLQDECNDFFKKKYLQGTWGIFFCHTFCNIPKRRQGQILFIDRTIWLCTWAT